MLKIPSHAERVFSGTLHDVYQWRQEMFDGSFQVFEGLKRADAVVVIAVTRENKIVGLRAFVWVKLAERSALQ